MRFLISALLLIAFASGTAHSQTPQFIQPLEGNYPGDFFLVNYVDWSFQNIKDYHCGNKTYDGHQGTDFVIRNFSQMDSGVNVYAAANGKVIFSVDTFFDRNKTAVSGGLGNYVGIRHTGNWYSYYGHLKKNSVLVQKGDSVIAGEKIGEVGSSGYASDPHLHFEVWYDSLYVVDPFGGGACGNPSSMWSNQLPYVHQFGIIDHGLMGFVPTLDTLKERIPDRSTFSSTDDAITFWMQGYGVFPGDISKVKWFAPDGSLWFSYSFTHPDELWYFYWWSYIDVPVSKPGTWRVEYYLNGSKKITDTFFVRKENQFTSGNSIHLVFQNQHLYIQLREAATHDLSMKIYDVPGRLVEEKFILQGMNSLDWNTNILPAGIYILKAGDLPAQPFSVF